MKSPSSCSRSRRRRSSRRIRRTGGRSRNRSRGTRYSRSPAPGRSPAGMSSFAEMPNLLALSFEGTLPPAFDLHCLELSRTPPDGWGIACYPGGEPAALVLKEAAPSHDSIRSALVSAWGRLEARIFLGHLRPGLIAHSAGLEPGLPQPTRFEPVGSTDSEQILCDLLGRAAEKDYRSRADIPNPTLLSWFHDLNRHGSLTTALSDGLDLAVYADRRGNGEAWGWGVLPPHGQLAFGDDDLTVDLTRRGVHSRKGIIVSSNPLPARKGEQGQWRRLIPGHLLIVRQGAVRAELGPESLADPDAANAPVPVAPPVTGTRPPAQTHSAQAMAARPAGAPSSEPPPAFVPRARPLHVTTRAEKRRYEVLHRTVYRYASPVERSAHVLRLFPPHDRLQTLHSCEVKVSVPGHERDFDV